MCTQLEFELQYKASGTVLNECYTVRLKLFLLPRGSPFLDFSISGFLLSRTVDGCWLRAARAFAQRGGCDHRRGSSARALPLTRALMESSLQASRLLSPPEMCVCACVRASEPVCDGSPAGRACPFCAPMRRVALVSFASPPPATLHGVSTHPSALFSSSLCQASSSQRFFCHVLEVLPVGSSHLL